MRVFFFFFCYQEACLSFSLYSVLIACLQLEIDIVIVSQVRPTSAEVGRACRTRNDSGGN